jgi:hypothetical protein
MPPNAGYAANVRSSSGSIARSRSILPWNVCVVPDAVDCLIRAKVGPAGFAAGDASSSKA